MQDVILWNLTFLFSVSHKKYSLVLITSIALEKCKKRKRYCFDYSGTRFFPLKIKITQFRDGIHLNFWLVGHGTSLSKGYWGRLKLRASYVRKNIIPWLFPGVKNIKDLPWHSETFADLENVCFSQTVATLSLSFSWDFHSMITRHKQNLKHSFFQHIY